MLTLTNPLSNPIVGEVTHTAGKVLDIGGGAVAGMAVGKLTQLTIGAKISEWLQGQSWWDSTQSATKGFAGMTLSGAIAVTAVSLLNRYGRDLPVIGNWLSAKGDYVEAGAYTVALLPFLRAAADMVNAPGWVKQSLAGPNRYYVPVGAEYAAQVQKLGGFAPGDFGDNASPNYPALAGVAPDFDAPDQYTNANLGVFIPQTY